MIEEKYILNAKNVDIIAERIYAYCLSLNLNKRLARNYSINIDNALVSWLKSAENKNISLKLGKRYFKERIVVELEGDPLNPFIDDDEYDSFKNAILKNSGLRPSYIYKNNVNRIEFKVDGKNKNPILKLLTIVLLTAIIAFFLKHTLSETVIQSILDIVIIPLYELFFRLLGCVAGPMIFLSVTWGIYGIGDSMTFKNVGQKVIKKEVLTTFLAVILCAGLFAFFDLQMVNKNDSISGISAIINLILGIVPSTIVEPFVSGNTLQIIFLAIVVGSALIFLESQTASIAKAIEQFNHLINFLMEFIATLVPFIVILVEMEMIWNNNYTIIIGSWYFLLILILAMVSATALIILKAAFTYKISPLTLVKKNYKTFIISLITASSVASFFENVKNGEKEFGMNSKFTSFAIPLGMMLHKPMAAIYNLLIIFYFASIYNVAISPISVIIAVITSGFVAISTPPIPGGAMASYVLLFNQMGIPMEALGVVTALDVITDFFITAFETYAINYSLIDVAAKTSMLDIDVLVNKK